MTKCIFTSYVVITPARNEQEHVEKTITSIVSQNVRPRLWVLVDDGSSDHTPDIVARYTILYPWIKFVRRKDRGHRKQGGGVVEAFYEGYKLVVNMDWDYIVKLDADLSFDPDYFKKAFVKFSEDPRLGIGGGLIHNTDGEEIWVEKKKDPLFHVRGATKIYRRSCWEDIGELIRAPGWDTLDEVKANMKGWTTRTFSDIPIIHHRFTGGADGNWKNQVKNGRANYISGYHPLFMFFKCLKRFWQYPYIIGSLGLSWGYVSSYVLRIPKVDDTDLLRYLRQQQIRRLLFQNSMWK